LRCRLTLCSAACLARPSSYRGLDRRRQWRARGGDRGGPPGQICRLWRGQEPTPEPRPADGLRQGTSCARRGGVVKGWTKNASGRRRFLTGHLADLPAPFPSARSCCRRATRSSSTPHLRRRRLPSPARRARRCSNRSWNGPSNHSSPLPPHVLPLDVVRR
jgi:hypothetical protein